ncbi:E2f-associated phosphoprotein [Thalictrum thalictroides]|uniref:E2f-associated phosphoprotein n=1 Tax=Thalictrum thalictroides TaxID=46969 RepID=A0A7J6UTM2_THATH|nr:E2f-associated phosphoprotein [Thalictrum thalictroides]
MDSSPNGSEKMISDDDVIDYSVKPEFYDPELDAKDELWVHKKRSGVVSDAVLSCPACFTTLCLESQRHEKIVTQYRAVFVENCKIKNEEVVQVESNKKQLKRKRGKNGFEAVESGKVKPVCCLVCSARVGVIDEDEVYHFFDVIPSEA